jgi:molecular chaperone DnaK
MILAAEHLTFPSLNIVDGQYMEAGTGGDRWLGGDDLDRKLQAVVLEKVSTQEYNISDI